MTASLQLQKKISEREPQGAWRKDELIFCTETDNAILNFERLKHVHEDVQYNEHKCIHNSDGTTSMDETAS
jgi:hypothetical protein